MMVKLLKFLKELAFYFGPQPSPTCDDEEQP